MQVFSIFYNQHINKKGHTITDATFPVQYHYSIFPLIGTLHAASAFIIRMACRDVACSVRYTSAKQ